MTKPTFDVLTIGNAIVDVFSRVEETFLARHNVSKGMMRLISEADSAPSATARAAFMHGESFVRLSPAAIKFVWSRTA